MGSTMTPPSVRPFPAKKSKKPKVSTAVGPISLTDEELAQVVGGIAIIGTLVIATRPR
jgi:bacteriocin-like protein